MNTYVELAAADVPTRQAAALTGVARATATRAASRGACQMVCVSRTERNGKNHDHDRREDAGRAVGPGPG